MRYPVSTVPATLVDVYHIGPRQSDRPVRRLLLAVRKPAAAVAGGHRAILDVQGVSSGWQWLEHEDCISRSRSASSFANITASQNEVTASQASVPPCTKVWIAAVFRLQEDGNPTWCQNLK